MQDQNTQEEITVVFLIPFASKSVKKDWRQASTHLQQTLFSIQNSSSPNFRVVVAGNEPPDFWIENDERFKFISLDKVNPDEKINLKISFMKKDKHAKIKAAWEYSQKHYKSKYVFKFDADDLVSSRLVEWLDAAEIQPGFLITQGWIWKSGEKKLIQASEQFDQLCGSCILINSDVAELEGPFLTDEEGHIIDNLHSGKNNIEKNSLPAGSLQGSLLLNESHFRVKAQYSYLGLPLSYLPFPGVIYRSSNRDSTSASINHKKTARQIIGAWRRTRLITRNIAAEFSLPCK